MIKKTIYTSGAIEFSKDPLTWRNQLVRALCKTYTVINPKEVFCPYTKSETEYKDFIFKSCVIPDMEFVMKCDYFFVKIDKNNITYASGTWGELSLAAYLNKHIVYYLDDVKEEEISGWVLGCLTKAIKVNSIKDAIDLYKQLATK